mgnify:CR=1 FL=1
MKKLLGILVLGLLWCNVGFAEQTTMISSPAGSECSIDSLAWCRGVLFLPILLWESQYHILLENNLAQHTQIGLRVVERRKFRFIGSFWHLARLADNRFLTLNPLFLIFNKGKSRMELYFGETHCWLPGDSIMARKYCQDSEKSVLVCIANRF